MGLDFQGSNPHRGTTLVHNTQDSPQQDNSLAEEGFALNFRAGLNAFCSAVQPIEGWR